MARCFLWGLVMIPKGRQVGLEMWDQGQIHKHLSRLHRQVIADLNRRGKRSLLMCPWVGQNLQCPRQGMASHFQRPEKSLKAGQEVMSERDTYLWNLTDERFWTKSQKYRRR